MRGTLSKTVLEQCRQLEVLDVANNQLDGLPDDVGTLRLKKLDVSNNGQFRLKPGNADALSARLQVLLIASNNLGSFPGAVLQLHALRELDLHDNGLADVPDRFSELPMLETINLSANRLASCPSTLTHLKKLQIANLSRNQMSSLTSAFCAALSSTLTSLELAGNRLGECVASETDCPFARLTAVASLDLTDNRIERLSPMFGLLTKLRSLKLEQNNITAMPVQLILLQTCLRELDLSANPLRELPPEYGYFSVEYGGLIPRIKLVGVALDAPASRHLAESDRALMRFLKEKARYAPPFAELRIGGGDGSQPSTPRGGGTAAIASPYDNDGDPNDLPMPRKRAPTATSPRGATVSSGSSASSLSRQASGALPPSQRAAAPLPGKSAASSASTASTGRAKAAVMQPAQLDLIDKTLDELLDTATQLNDAAQQEFDYIDAMRPFARTLGQLTRDALGVVRDATNNNDTDDVNARALAAAAVRLATAASTCAKATRERAAEASATTISDDLTPGQVAMQTSVDALASEANACKRAVAAARNVRPAAAPVVVRTPAVATQAPKPTPAPAPAPVAAPANDDVEIDEDEWSSLINMVDDAAAVASTPLKPTAAAAAKKASPPKKEEVVEEEPLEDLVPMSSYDEMYGVDNSSASTPSKPTRAVASPPPAVDNDDGDEFDNAGGSGGGDGDGEAPSFTIVVCGAGRAGKTALVTRLVKQYFEAEYEPTLDKDVYKKRIELAEGPVDLKIIDAAGVDENAAYRDQDYRSADGFIMTFSVVASETFKEMRNVVARQIAAAKGADLLRARKLPLVVVGTHADRNMGLRGVQRSDAAALARVLGAPYVEASSLDDLNCAEPFELLARRLAHGDSHEREQAVADEQQRAGMARAQGTRDGRRGLHRPTFIASQPTASSDRTSDASSLASKTPPVRTRMGANEGAQSQRFDSRAADESPLAVRRPVGAVAMPGMGGVGGGVDDALAAALARRGSAPTGGGGDAAPGRMGRAVSMRGPPSQLRTPTPTSPASRSPATLNRGQSVMLAAARADAAEASGPSLPPFGGVALQDPSFATGPISFQQQAMQASQPPDMYGELPLAPAARQQVVPLEQRPFFRNCSRQEAEAYLQASPDGTFLLRPSSQPRAKCTLSSRSYAGEIGHALISETDKGFHLETVEGYYSSIDELLRALPIDHDLIG
jgi:small GTP-binding protein